MLFSPSVTLSILPLLISIICVPLFAGSRTRYRVAPWLYALAGAWGFVATVGRFRPDWAAAALFEGPLIFGAWLALWSTVGWLRRRRIVASAPPPRA